MDKIEYYMGMEEGIGKVFASERERMVDEQLIPRGVRDQGVLAAMRKVERERFVPPGESARSYLDGPLPIGSGQTISQPYIVAYMTELMELRGGEKVLELGTGSGYQTAVLAEMGADTYTVERIPQLAERAEKLLRDEMGYPNIQFRTGNGAEGWAEHAPFDRIIVTASPEEFPESLFRQLGEGGIIISPVGGFFQNIVKFEKKGGKILKSVQIAVSFVPLVLD